MAKTRVQTEPNDQSDRDDLAQLSAVSMPDSPGGIVASGGTMQQVRGSYCTAVSVQRPRVLHEIQKRLKQEAMLCGEDFYYGWGAGDNRIEGPSVKLAMAAARCWGNCAVQMLPVQESPQAWTFTAVFIDLETGFTLERQFRQAKDTVVYGKHDDVRKNEMRFSIGQSKACRNVVLNSLPAVLIDQAMKEAKDGVRDRLERYIKENGLPAARDLLIRALAKSGVTEERICTKFNVAKKDGMSLDDLVILKGDLSAIEKGQERPEELFPTTKEGQVEDLLKQARANQPSATTTAVSGPPVDPPTQTIPGVQVSGTATTSPATNQPVQNEPKVAVAPPKKEEVVWATPEQNQQLDDLVADLAMKPKAFSDKCKEMKADPQRPTKEQAQLLIQWLCGLVAERDKDR